MRICYSDDVIVDQREMVEEDQHSEDGSNQTDKKQTDGLEDAGNCSQEPRDMESEESKNPEANTSENSESIEVEIHKEKPEEKTELEGHKDGEDVEMKEVEEEKSDNSERPLFKIVVVNSYGSQEVQQLEQHKTYTFSSTLDG